MRFIPFYFCEGCCHVVCKKILPMCSILTIADKIDFVKGVWVVFPHVWGFSPQYLIPLILRCSLCFSLSLSVLCGELFPTLRVLTVWVFECIGSL